MMNRRHVFTVLVACLATKSAFSHPSDPLKSDQINIIEHQILHAREALEAAILAKDAVKLKSMYAPSFTHTHGSGKIDGRDARIVSLLTGEPVIEIAKVHELTIRVVHGDTAIVTGKSPILNRTENRDYDFRWMQVWVHIEGDWQLAASQATRLPLIS